LIIAGALHTERRLDSNGQVVNRDKVNNAVIGAVHAEIVDLTAIVAPSVLRSKMMAVAAADCKTDGPLPNPSRLALNAAELAAIIDGKVISRVLAKRR
jgi:hypothetical protein